MPSEPDDTNANLNTLEDQLRKPTMDTIGKMATWVAMYNAGQWDELIFQIEVAPEQYRNQLLGASIVILSHAQRDRGRFKN